MKKALVLAGGGTRGSYQNGAVHALRELRKDDWDLVCGTSIGALNAALIVQRDYKAMDELWHHLSHDQIINGTAVLDMNFNDMINERGEIRHMLQQFLKDKGVDISPLICKIKSLYRPQAFFDSPIDFGCVVAKNHTHEAVYVTKDMMKEHGTDWLIATASAYPVFPVHMVAGEAYIDGGYADNLPIHEALSFGAQEIIAIDLRFPPQHANYVDDPHITYIFPHIETGSFLQFNAEVIHRLETVGYLDTMKAFGALDGVKYTFRKTPLPLWWPSFYRDFLLLEDRLGKAWNVRSLRPLTDRLFRQENRFMHTDAQYFFGILDSLMDLINADVEKIHTYQEVRNQILAVFAHCADANYNWKPSLQPSQLLEYTKNLDTKGVIEKMIHAQLYPEHDFLGSTIALTVYPSAMVQGMFVVAMMKELGGED